MYLTYGIRRAGRTKVILVHNHPTGVPEASTDDLATTVLFERRFRDHGLRLGGHLIIDTEEVTWITMSGPDREPRVKRLVVLAELRPAPDWAGTLSQVPRVTTPRAVLQLVRDRTTPVVFYINSRNRVVAAEPHGMAAMERLPRWLPQRMRHWVAAKAFLVFHGFADWRTGLELVNRHRGQLYFVLDVLDTQASRSAAAEAALRPAPEPRVRSWRLREGLRPASGSEDVLGYRARGAPEDVERAADRGDLAPVTPFRHGFDPRTAQESGQPLTPGRGLLTVKCRAQIIGDIARALDIPIREALPRRRKWAGLYFPRGREVRLKLYSDIETVAREVGHHIQTLLFGPDAYTRQGNLSQRPGNTPDEASMGPHSFECGNTILVRN